LEWELWHEFWNLNDKMNEAKKTGLAHIPLGQGMGFTEVEVWGLVLMAGLDPSLVDLGMVQKTTRTYL
jgi:hypothetical protein